jgi:hypothetical protein
MNKYSSDPYIKSNELIANNFRDLKIFNLKASASAQFDEAELQNIVNKYPDEKITIVDLRLEYHGFINGIPMTFRNHDLSTNTFDSSQEKNILSSLLNNKQFATETLKYYSRFTNDTEINQSLTEEQLALNYHCNYQRFALKDHHFPTPQQFSTIINFLNDIEKDPKQRIHVHCAAGRGRTAIFLVIYDILKNHKSATLEQIFTRQAKLGGANLANIAYEDEWPKDQKQNIQMLYDFYEQLNQS